MNLFLSFLQVVGGFTVAGILLIAAAWSFGFVEFYSDVSVEEKRRGH